MLINSYEATFGYTIEAGEADGSGLTYAVKDKDASGIKYKNSDSELLTMYLIPESGQKMDYGKVVEMNNTAIKRLEKKIEENKENEDNADKIFKNTSKVRLLTKLNEMIGKWVEENNPLKKAQDLFGELLCSQYPEQGSLLRLV